MKFLKYLNNNFLFRLVLTRNYRRPATINLSRWKSQHNEERNLENILPLLETIEEDDAEQLLLTITVELKTTFCSTMVVLHTCSGGLPAKQGARPRRRAQWAGLWCQWLWTRGRRCWRCSRWWWCTLGTHGAQGSRDHRLLNGSSQSLGVRHRGRC